MSTEYAHGSDGHCKLPTGFNARLNTWSANLTRTTTVTTGFGASVQDRRASKVIDCTGSAGGFPLYGSGSGSASENSISPIKHSGTDFDDRAGGTIILFFFDSDGDGSDADTNVDLSITFDAVFNSFDFGVTQDGESTVTFNFEMNDANGISTTWDETA